MPFDTITMVSRARAEQIIEEYQPEGMFITLGETGYVAIDNRTNDAWTEEFMTLAEACRWVQGSYVKGEEYDEEDEDEEEMGDDQAERFRQCIQDGISNNRTHARNNQAAGRVHRQSTSGGLQGHTGETVHPGIHEGDADARIPGVLPILPHNHRLRVHGQ